MKKTLIASAIAATLSVNAFADDHAAKTAMPTVYGSIELVHLSTDNDALTTHEFQDNGSTIGISHEHAVSEGLTAFALIDMEFEADDENTSSGLNVVDEAYIGLRGDFGSVQAGTFDTVYEWVDVLDTSEAVGLGAIFEPNNGDNIQYVSPVIADGLTLGVTAPVDSDTNFGGALAAKYAVDNLSVALAYTMGREEGGFDAEDIIGLGVSFSMDELTLLAQYETQKDTADLFGVMGMYTMGQNVFALGYQMISPDFSGAEDQSDIYVQALHNLSSNAYIYLEYLMQTDIGGTADADLDTLAIGATYKF
jgi:predicted porin